MFVILQIETIFVFCGSFGKCVCVGGGNKNQVLWLLILIWFELWNVIYFFGASFIVFGFIYFTDDAVFVV